MKYKVEKGCALYDTLMSVYEQMKTAQAAANAIVSEIPEADGFSKYSHGIAGGIAAFHFKQGSRTAKDGWKKMEKGYTSWFMLKSGDKRNKEMLDRIAALPIVDHDAINKPLNFSFTVGGALEVWHCPKVWWAKKCILIETPDWYKGKSVDGMVEILASEFVKLTEEKQLLDY